MTIKRRQFIGLLGSAAVAWPLSARAQVVRRVGVLMNAAATDSNPQSYLAAFVQGLRQLGWTEGQNIRIDVRWNAGDAQLARIYAAQLIGLNPDVIVTASTTNLTIVRQATSNIPIVFTQVSDPVAQGFVESIAKPGGNLTGFSMFEFSVGGKWLGLLKEIAPRLARVGVLFNPDTSPQSAFFMRSIEAAAPTLGVQAIAVPVRGTNEIEPAIENLARGGNGGLILPTDTFTYLRLNLIGDLASKHRMPSIAAADIFPRSGGLMYYGASVSLPNQFRQAAGYVDRILKGAKPADLPVQRSDKYTFVVNLKTAKALGLDVPPTLLALADEVIE
jgi:putative ABC transport system substrate-binding protein